MPERPVFYFTRMVPVYRLPVLERLNARLDGRLVVCAGEPPRASSLRSLTDEQPRRFRQVRLRNIWLGGETLHAQPFRQVFQDFGHPSVLLAEESPRSLSLPLLLRYARRRNVGRLLWGHFSSNDRAFSPRHPADRYRIALARSVEACVCYTEPIADSLRPYVPAERLFVARNTLDTDTLFALHDTLAAEGRGAVRRRLGLPTEAPVLVFIGRLIKAKGTDRLLDVFGALRARRAAHLLVIGAGPEQEAMKARVARQQIDHVHFLGALPAWADSAPYLFAADLMLMPGYLGLAVNHAFAFGLPVVSQATPDPAIRFHSPEVAYLRPGENGLLARHDDPTALLEAVERVLADRVRFSQNAYDYARTHLTIDQMVDGLEAAIGFVEDQCLSV